VWGKDPLDTHTRHPECVMGTQERRHAACRGITLKNRRPRRAESSDHGLRRYLWWEGSRKRSGVIGEHPASKEQEEAAKGRSRPQVKPTLPNHFETLSKASPIVTRGKKQTKLELGPQKKINPDQGVARDSRQQPCTKREPMYGEAKKMKENNSSRMLKKRKKLDKSI